MCDCIFFTHPRRMLYDCVLPWGGDAGTISSVSAATTLTACTVCAYGSYQASAGQSACISCAGSTYSAGGINPCSSVIPIVLYDNFGAGYCHPSVTGGMKSTDCRLPINSGYYIYCASTAGYTDDSPGGGGPIRRLFEEEEFALAIPYSTAGGSVPSGQTAFTDQFGVEVHTVITEYCSLCPSGAYCPGSNGITYRCPAGTSQSLTGQQSCTSCSAGYYSSTGASACTQCAAGQFAVFAGTSQCSTCVAGEKSI